MRFFVWPIVMTLVVSSLPAQAACASPTVRELESALGYSPGAQIPKDVPACGRGLHIYYIGARALGNGEYDVRVKLR